MILSRSSCIGIDLGNEKSVVCIARAQKLETLTNPEGGRKTASCVAFNGQKRLVGNEAHNEMNSNYKNCITAAKRLIGRNWEDPKFQEERSHLEYELADAGADGVSVSVDYNGERAVLDPRHIVGMLLKKFKDQAQEAMNGQAADDCVIACPSYWTVDQRRGIIDAAKLVGFNVVRLMNDVTAVAANYGLLRPLPKKSINVMFVDMGLTSLAVGIATMVEGSVKMISLASDPHLGARDFVNVVVKILAKNIQEKYKMDVLSNQKARVRLRKEATRVLKTLSANTKVKFEVENIMNDKDVNGFIERGDFEKAAAELTARVAIPIQEAMASAKVTSDSLHSVELVGGATKIPSVQRAIKQAAGKENVSFTCDVDESVAKGCCLQCALLSPSFKMKAFEITDICSYPMTLHWQKPPGGDATVVDDALIFKRFNSMPSTKEIGFKGYTKPFEVWMTYADTDKFPREMDYSSVKDPLISRFVCTGISEHENTDVCKVKIRVKLDGLGLASITSATLLEKVIEEEKKEDEKKEGDKKEEEKKEVKKKNKVRRVDLALKCLRANEISQESIDAIKVRESKMSELDSLLQSVQEARNRVESYVLDLRSELDYSLKPFIDPSTVQDLRDQLNDAEDWLYDQEEVEGQEAIVLFDNKLTEVRKLGEPLFEKKRGAGLRKSVVEDAKYFLAKVISKAKEPISYDASALGSESSGEAAEGDKDKKAEEGAEGEGDASDKKDTKDKEEPKESLAKANAEARKSADDKRVAILTKAEEMDRWLKEVQEKQSKLGLSDSPAFSPDEVVEKQRALATEWETVTVLLTRFQDKEAAKKKDESKESEENAEPLKALM